MEAETGRQEAEHSACGVDEKNRVERMRKPPCSTGTPVPSSSKEQGKGPFPRVPLVTAGEATGWVLFSGFSMASHSISLCSPGWLS